MSRTLTGTFFNEQWHADNAQDVQRARYLNIFAVAKAQLLRMSPDERATDLADAVREAENILTREN